MQNYIEINKESWNNRLEAHLRSDFYDLNSFIEGKSSLNKIELDILGDIKGKNILHLQCHFGQDTISLSRLGANVTGVDFSEKSIEKAKELAEITNSKAEFICCDIYDLPNLLNKKYDIVFTSYGTIAWLPDLDKWAYVISNFMKKNSRFIFVEFHPVVWMFDDDIEKIIYPYLKSDAIIEDEVGTYADKSAEIQQKCVTWNHGISEVVNSLISKGLHIQCLNEYDYSPYPFVNNSEEYEKGKFRIKQYQNKLPLVYAIEAIKK